MGKIATFVTILPPWSGGLGLDALSGKEAPAGAASAQEDGRQANGAFLSPGPAAPGPTGYEIKAFNLSL